MIITQAGWKNKNGDRQSRTGSIPVRLIAMAQYFRKIIPAAMAAMLSTEHTMSYQCTFGMV